MGWLSAPMLGAALLCAAQMAAQEPTAVQGDVLEARIWLDRGVDPVLRRGDQVRVYYRASRDAFVSIFHIDTNGFARLLHPGSPTDDHFVLGGRDYRVLFPESRYWHVDEDEGKGYLFIVASPEPLDFSNFTYSRRRGGWDITAMAQTGYRDPFLVMDDVVAALILQWGAEDYALDFHAYDVDQPHDYPRFLCYDCHGFIPIFDWNPYDYWCTDFRVVIHDDPYYYPVYRYRGDRVVYTRPVARLRPMFEFKERAGDEPALRNRSTSRTSPTRVGGGGWDITAMAQTGYRDPFLVMDDVVAALIPQWWAEDYALDFHAYDVDQPHDYPRFLCYDCHGFIPIFDWNPYDYWCTDFRVVIHDDPYYYPVYRYRGDRVVYTRPVARLRPMFEFKERAGDEPATPLIRSRTPTRPRLPARDVDVGAGAPRATPEGRVPPLATDPPGAAGRRVPVERVDPGVRPNPAGGSAAGPPLPDPLPRGARERSVQEVPAGTRSAEGREERPVLRRRPEPPAAGSTQPPAARPRTPPSGRPPPPADSPPPAGSVLVTTHPSGTRRSL